jgi:enoyl-CoA hydratase/carnithine racemase
MHTVEYTKKDHLAIITMDRPDSLNALNRDMLVALRESWIRYRDDEDAWIAVLTATGRAFSAGADKEWFEKSLSGNTSIDDFTAITSTDPYWSGHLDKPVIAAVNGFCVGAGFHLVLRADLRTSSENAWFQQPEVQRGGIMVMFDNLPCAIASEMISGFRISAQRAYEVGIINRLFPDEALTEGTMKMAEELLDRQPLALYHALRVLRDIKNVSVVPRSLIDRYAVELSRGLMDTVDWREGTTAFLEKRKPLFKKE